MLRSLSIRNYAIIDSVELQFDEGLAVITGETGAGKSIILGALGLILGDRAEPRLLGEIDKKVVVEARFDVSGYEIKDLFASLDLDYEVDSIFRREILPTGKSRAFINDTPVRLADLRQVASQLVDLHRQHDKIDMLNAGRQSWYYDALAGTLALREQYMQSWSAFRQAEQAHHNAREKALTAARDADYLRFQLGELEGIALQSSTDQQEAEAEASRLRHAEDIGRALHQLNQVLSEGDLPICDALARAVQALEQLKVADNQVTAIADRAESLRLESESLSQDIQRLLPDLEPDQERLDEIDEALDALNRLLNKHRLGEATELFALGEQWQSQLQQIDDSDREIESLVQAMHHAQEKLQGVGKELSHKRTQAKAGIEEAIQQQLVHLGMANNRFIVDLEGCDTLGALGQEKVKFLFSANKGMAPRPLQDVASGGELSRILLAFKANMAEGVELPTLVFDEIDAGISGETGLRVGDVLSELAHRHQVICITHLPQIAARGQKHYHISKTGNDETTISLADQLDGERRTKEIARLLYGEEPTQAALDNAKDLLSRRG